MARYPRLLRRLSSTLAPPPDYSAYETSERNRSRRAELRPHAPRALSLLIGLCMLGKTAHSVEHELTMKDEDG